MENEIIRAETKRMMKLFQKLTKFYDVPKKDKDSQLWEITEDFLKSPFVDPQKKQAIESTGRRIFIFIYPSDGLKVKGIISFVLNPSLYPTIVLLRGGNRIFGIPNPADDLFSPGNFTVVSTLYRDGVSEGTDEYGGKDVNDVKHLIDFLPHLEDQLQLTFQKDKMFLVGCSRGGMQLFLTLARFPELQKRFKKAVSLCGVLDMRHCIDSRSDMKEMFIDDFGLKEGVNESSWIELRDPLKTVEKIDPQLPILIIQGTSDIRVDLIEGHRMVERLLAHGSDVTYWEVEDGDHCLRNVKEKTQKICEWLVS